MIKKFQGGIKDFDQLVFFLSAPSFYFFFSCNSIVYVLSAFVVNKIKAIISSGKSFCVAFVNVVFGYSLLKIVSDADIKYRLLIISQNVNIVLTIIVKHHQYRIDASYLGMTIRKLGNGAQSRTTKFETLNERLKTKD